jgi:hypothetical protein
VKLPGSDQFIDLANATNLPPGTIIELPGNAVIQLTDPQGNVMTFSNDLGATATDGVPTEFVYNGVVNGVVQITLVGGNFSSYRLTQAHGAAKKPKPKKPVRRLWGSGKGNFTTKGKYAAATVRGTTWLIADFKDGTRVYVKRGLVTVRDFVKKKTVKVKAGHSYFAASKKKKATHKK